MLYSIHKKYRVQGETTNMTITIDICNVVKVENITDRNNATIVYKDQNHSENRIPLKVAELCWLKKYPQKSALDKLSYRVNKMHYIADRKRISNTERIIVFYLPQDTTIVLYSDSTTEKSYFRLLNTLNSQRWCTFDCN